MLLFILNKGFERRKRRFKIALSSHDLFCPTDYRSGDWRRDGVILLKGLRRACTACPRFFKHQILWTWRNFSAESLPSLTLWSSLPMAILDRQMFLVCLILVGRYRIRSTNEGNKHLSRFEWFFLNFPFSAGCLHPGSSKSLRRGTAP